MGINELIAQGVQPVADPVNQMRNIAALQGQVQQNQLARTQQQGADIDLQMKQQQQQDQQAMTKAMQQWDGSSYDSLIPIAVKNGASAQTVMALKQHAIDSRAKVAETLKNEGEAGKFKVDTQMKNNDMVAGALNNVMQQPDAVLPQALIQTANDLAQKGLIDPQHAQMAQQIAQSSDPNSIRQALDFFRKGYMADTQIAAEAKAKADLEHQKAADAETMRHNKSMEDKPTEVGLAERAAAGDQQAKDALDQLAKTKQMSKVVVGGGKSDARMDHSFQFNSSALTKISDPIEQLAGRVGRLKDTLSQATPQADAFVAPEALTIMAGGAGSGLRMNEAEISRIVGGRSAFESLKASLNKYQLDPTKANSITPAQRSQINALVDAVGQKLVQKRQIVEDANQNLINAPSVEAHRKIVADARKALADVDAGTYKAPASSGGNSSSGDPFSQFGGVKH